VRADARRKYDRIVEVATDLFFKQGIDASLNEVAKRAQVGPGTLYRHFPTREDLISATMKDWVEQIQAAADRAVASSQPPRALLLTWFEAFVAHIAKHPGAPGRLIAAMDNPGSPLHRKGEVLIEANARVIDRLRAEGALRGDVDSANICRLVIGVAAVADHGKLDPGAVRSMVAIVADALLHEPRHRSQVTHPGRPAVRQARALAKRARARE
jgi:AcrR family transcriptional regulator